MRKKKNIDAFYSFESIPKKAKLISSLLEESYELALKICYPIKTFFFKSWKEFLCPSIWKYNLHCKKIVSEKTKESITTPGKDQNSNNNNNKYKIKTFIFFLFNSLEIINYKTMEKMRNIPFSFSIVFFSAYFQSNQSGFEVIHWCIHLMLIIFNQISKKCNIFSFTNNNTNFITLHCDMFVNIFL